MPDRTIPLPRPFAAAARAAILLSMISTSMSDRAWSQTPPAQAPQVQAPQAQTPQQPTSSEAAPTQPAPNPSAPNQPASSQAAAAPPKDENPGLISEIGKLLHRLPTLKSPSETIDDLNQRTKDATKGATETLTNLARPSSMVGGRTICPASANGAPDCKAAADKLCQDKGYKEGHSLTMDSAEKCSAKVLIPGRTRKPDDCHIDNYVTAALCQ
jgi:hypothetical protein